MSLPDDDRVFGGTEYTPTPPSDRARAGFSPVRNGKYGEPQFQGSKESAEDKDLGRKFDQDKTDWSLLPWSEAEEIVKVLMFGAKKYDRDNWKRVKNAKLRYFSAAIRHLAAWLSGEKYDSESNLSHLSHAGCCILFLLWADKNEKD